MTATPNINGAPTGPQEVFTERFESLLLTAIAESSRNPRKTYDDPAMLDLTASVKQKGVIEPIITRPHPKPTKAITHELVAGSRRFRAAKSAGLTVIPSIIRNYSDVDVLEVMLIENEQREEVHPLQQADGYRELLDLKADYTPEILAEKIGHEPAYVYQRLALTRLTKKAREAFLKDDINIGHATRLARLPADAQDFAFTELLFEDGQGHENEKGVWVHDTYPVSVRVFDRLIQQQVFLDLGRAPWKLDDAKMISKAGACTACPKRTGANAALFDELKKGDMCLDRACFQKKVDASLVQIELKHKEDKDPLTRISNGWRPRNDGLKMIGTDSYVLLDEHRKPCGKSVSAIYFEGPDRGQIVRICKDKTCTVHHKTNSSSGGSSGKKDYWSARAETLETNIKTKVRRAAISAIADKPHKWTVPHDQLQVVALALLSHGVPPELIDCIAVPSVPLGVKRRSDEASDVLKKLIMSPKGSPAADNLPRIVTALALQEWAKDFPPYNNTRLDLAAEAFGVDMKKISTEIGTSLRSEFTAKRKKSEAKKAAAQAPKVRVPKPSRPAPKKKKDAPQVKVPPATKKAAKKGTAKKK